jgi:hypothetical protein
MPAPKSERRKKARDKKRAEKAARMKRPGERSKYARKISGDLPENSPYRTRWPDAFPLGGIPSAVSSRRRIDAEAKARAGTR